ncbi:phosphotransferase family protein [soil metagenome]
MDWRLIAMPVAPVNGDFDVTRLAQHLQSRLPVGPGELRATPIAGGASNPTFILDWPEAGEGPRYVLRKKPPGVLLPSAHQIEREYRIMTALADTAVPVPATRFIDETSEVVGTPFYVMDFVDGRIFRDARLPGLDPNDRREIYGSFVEIMAALHSVDPDKAGLGDLGRREDFFGRQLSRWTQQYRSAETESLDAMERLITLLEGRLPKEGAARIVHGDLRIENIMVHPERPQGLALLDWELCTLGDPLADLGYACVGYHSDQPWFGRLGRLDLASQGLPSEADLVDHYCRLTGRSAVGDWGFYVAFALFRLAAIAQGVFKRGQQGNGAAHVAAQVNVAPDFARAALEALELRQPK